MTSFSPLDYAIFTAYLLMTVGLGVFFVRGQKGDPGEKSAGIGEFLLAGRGMGSVIVAISVLAALFSGITYLGSAAEVYVHDLSFLLIALSFFIATPVTTLLFLPFFYNARFFTAYQYLGERFALPVRTLASVLFIIRVLLWLALATYAPALSLNQVTGLPLWVMIVLTGTLTTFYTALGGMKAVIWTDVAQFCVLIGGQFAIVAVALHHIPGGIAGAYEIGKAGGKFTLNLSLHPTVRVTLWGLIIGGAFTNLVQLATDQVSVQRYLTATSIEAARKSLWLKLFLTLPVVALFYGTGVVLYAFYHAPGGVPDPLAAGQIGKADQILPYFVINELPAGLPALLVAAIFSASMSVVSAGLHALSTTTLVDILHPLRERKTGASFPATERTTGSEVTLVKTLIAGYGLLVVGLAFLVSRVGTLVEASNSLMGLVGGPVLGLFLLGMCSRKANTRGALVGWAVGFVTLGFVVFAKQISFLWYALIGCAVTYIVGVIVSVLFPEKPIKDETETSPEPLRAVAENP